MTNSPRTKIVCTLGPATSSPDTVKGLIGAGMNVARINFSHGDYQEHTHSIDAVRRTASELKQHVAILQDLPGPKCRTGRLKEESVTLESGADLVLTTTDMPGDKDRMTVSPSYLPQIVQPGSTVFLNDGAIKLEAEAVTETDIRCRVLVGGTMRPQRGVNIPGAPLPFTISAEEDFILFGIREGVDFIALSFVTGAADVLNVKKIIEERGADVPVIAKIERREALENIDGILQVADGAMVARGDLGVEIGIERVTLAQKEIIRKCNRLGKPVITATQMLESMMNSVSPTRAEAADVANAIFDGTDAIMLSGETAVGRYPVEAAAMMSRIALQTETALPYNEMLLKKEADLLPEASDATSYAACHIAHQLGAAAIVIFTTLGSTALRVAKYRPGVPILAITPYSATGRRLALSWGVNTFEMPQPPTVEALLSQGKELALETGVAKKGELIVITSGLPIGEPGSTNLVKIEEV